MHLEDWNWVPKCPEYINGIVFHLLEIDISPVYTEWHYIVDVWYLWHPHFLFQKVGEHLYCPRQAFWLKRTSSAHLLWSYIAEFRKYNLKPKVDLELKIFFNFNYKICFGSVLQSWVDHTSQLIIGSDEVVLFN